LVVAIRTLMAIKANKQSASKQRRKRQRATATLTTAQVLGGLLVVDPTTTASTLTLPTATAIDAVMTNMKTNSTFGLTVINIGTSTGLVTVAVGTGITAVGNLVVAITGSAAGVGGAAEFLFRKTGDAAYSVYRVA
jgi:membrane-associated HD superfamily phosphohydrolase